MRRLLLAICVVGLLISGGCNSRDGGKADKGAAASEIAAREGAVSRSLAGHLTLEVSGSIKGKFDGDTPLRIVTIVGSGAPKSAWLLSVGLDKPIELDNGRQARTAFDLIGYAGDGTYKIKAPKAGGLTAEELNKAQGQDPEKLAAQAANSDAFFLLGTQGTDVLTQYAKLDQPCTLVVRKRGNEGKLTCPRLSSDAGFVEMTWTWRADPDKVLEDLRPPSSSTTSPSTTAKASKGAASTTTTTTRGGSGGTSTTTTTSAQSISSGDIPIDVDIQPRCLTRGTVMKITITTIPDASITVAAAYSDGKNYDTYSLGRTDDKGTYRMASPISAEAPDGPANLLVSVSTSAGDKAGGKSQPFTVEPKC